MRLKQFFAEQDAWLAGACLLLLTAGLTTLYSLSLTTNGDYVLRQLLFAALAVFLLAVGGRVSLSDWRRFAPYFVLLTTALLFLTLLVGVSRNGAQRWLSIGLFSLQPVEFFKAAALLFAARFCARRARFNNGIKLAAPLFLWLSAPLLLIALQPDFGSFCLVSLAVATILFMSGLRWRVILLLLIIGAALAALMIFSEPYRLQRLTAFWDPFMDPYGAGYSQRHSLMAFARGGLWGEGLGRSIEKWGHLPESHNDFIIAIIAEEHGLAGVFAVMALLLFVAARAAMSGLAAGRRGEMFGAFYCFGAAAMLSMQVLANIGGSLALLPSKGFTLPLVSYGGSSLLATTLMLTILMRADYENRRHSQNGEKR